MNIFLKTWKKIANQGVSEDLSLTEQRRVRMLNQIVMGTLIGEILLVIQNLFPPSPTIWLLLTVTFYTASIIFVNSKKRFILARYMFTLFFPVVMTAIIIIYGENLRLEYSYLIFVLTSFIFFSKNKTQLLIFCFYVLLYGIGQYYISNYDSPFSARIEDVEKYIVFIAVSIIVGVIIRSYVTENLTYEGNINELLNQVQNQNIELNTAYEELEKFSYIASHDLKSPLRNIASFSGLLKRKLKEGDTQDNKEYLDYIITATKQMNFLITDVLEYSKINNQKDIELVHVSLMTLLEKVLFQLQSFIRDNNANVTFTPLPAIPSNEYFLTTLFQNLIENAIKYNKNGKPTVEIAHQWDKKREQLTLIFKDNGIGISEAYKNQVFEMFKRLHNSEEYQGTGIGLAQCKKMVEQLGGEIWLESETGQGTTFFVRLPAEELMELH